MRAAPPTRKATPCLEPRIAPRPAPAAEPAAAPSTNRATATTTATGACSGRLGPTSQSRCSYAAAAKQPTGSRGWPAADATRSVGVCGDRARLTTAVSPRRQPRLPRGRTPPTRSWPNPGTESRRPTPHVAPRWYPPAQCGDHRPQLGVGSMSADTDHRLSALRGVA
jgi:hypothetical protein